MYKNHRQQKDGGESWDHSQGDYIRRELSLLASLQKPELAEELWEGDKDQPTTIADGRSNLPRPPHTAQLDDATSQHGRSKTPDRR